MTQAHPKCSQVRLLLVTHEPWPTFRPDVVALFGKYLPRFDILSDLVTEESRSCGREQSWVAGKAVLCPGHRNRALHCLRKLVHILRILLACRKVHYDAIQVRDLPITSLAGLIVAHWKDLPFFYWMSFPFPESAIARARARGVKARLKYWFPLLQGYIGKWILYKIVLPRTDHIFVQSQRMKEDMSALGFDPQFMTAVPMGVDLEAAQVESIAPSDDPRLMGKFCLVYLGTLDRERRIDLLFDMMARIMEVRDDVLLLLVGDTKDSAHRAWLLRRARDLDVQRNVVFTGWLPTQEAWRYVRAAQIGLSPFPRTSLLESCSPTKAIEYLALEVPVLVNDQPDLARIIAESAAGVCVALTSEAFADAAIDLLADNERRQRMSRAGLAYVRNHRSYRMLAEQLAGIYRLLLRTSSETSMREEMSIGKNNAP